MIEAMKLALEALRNSVFDEHTADETFEAIKALEEALAKQEQSEPLIWSTTQGGAYVCGEYYVVQRVDDKGWNAHKDHEHLLLAASLDDCKAVCERDAASNLTKQEQGEPVAKAWAEGYRMGISDERTSEANIGIAGFNAKIEPDRQNPYGTPQPKQEQGEPVAWMYDWTSDEGEFIQDWTTSMAETLRDTGKTIITNVRPLYLTPQVIHKPLQHFGEIPMAWCRWSEYLGKWMYTHRQPTEELAWIPLYDHPQLKREWVELTDQELVALRERVQEYTPMDSIKYGEAIQRAMAEALKEKNA